MHLRKSFPSAIVALVAIIALSGCVQGGNAGSGGLKAGPGVDTKAKTITLGILSPETGPVSGPVGIPLENGVRAYFNFVNDNGGIDGYKINLVSKDSMYSPTQEAVGYNAIHNDVAMIADSLGTETTFAIKDASTQDQMLVTAATLSSQLAREKYLILAGTPYRLQTENAFDYVVNKANGAGAKVGIIYQDDGYGQDGQTGYKEAVAAYGLKDVGQAAVAANAKDYSAQVIQMKSAGAKYVFLTTVPQATATIIGTAAALGFFPQWILQSPAYSPLLLGVPALVPLFNHHVWVVSQGASWGDTTVPGMVEMLAAAKKYYPNQGPDGFFEFGYAISKVTAAILKKALDSNDISRAGLVNAYNGLGTVDVGGLLPALQYGTGTASRVPSRDSVVYEVDTSQPTTVKSLSGDFTGSAALASQF